MTDPDQQAQVAELTAWLGAGATLTQTAAGATSFRNSAAIQLFDAWWPLLLKAQFQFRRTSRWSSSRPDREPIAQDEPIAR